MVGNIGAPILKEKNIKNNTIFIIEVSSYQIDYSKYFQSDIAIILNISPDHLERHGNLKNYAKTKFKLIENQKKKSKSFVEIDNTLIRYLLKNKKIYSKITFVNYKKYNNFYNVLENHYFKNLSNIKNLSFILSLSRELKLKKNKIIQTVNNFKGLKYRQQIIFNNKKLMIINDSKSTSFSATLPLLESYENIYWILGGLAKKGDKLNLEKKLFNNIKAFIYGKSRRFFQMELKNKCKIQVSNNLRQTI